MAEREAMAGDTQVDQPQIEAEARKDGWRPQTEWSGRQEDWIDAATFIERGKSILPIVNAKAAKLQEENASLKAQLGATGARVETLQEQMTELQKTSQEILKERIKEERERLTAEIKAARKDEDVDRELAAQENLRKLDRQPEREVAETRTTAETRQPTLDPAAQAAFQSIIVGNPKYQSDPIYRAAVGQFAVQLAKEGKLENMSPEQRGHEIIRAADSYFNQFQRPAAVSRVAEANGRSANGSESRSSNGRKSYSDLPTSAREACDRQAKRIVKPNTRFDTEAKFRDHYVSLYYADEA